jgi:hypothetical protein
MTRSRRRPVELIVDPASGQLSASRLALLVLILVYLPVLVAAELLGHKVGIWAHLALIFSAVCGAYGANSAARVWRGGGLGEFMPPGPPRPRAKPAPSQGETHD